RKTIADGAQTATAVALDVHAQQAKLCDARNELTRECTGLEVLTNDGQHAILYKLAHGIPHHALFLAEKIINIIQVSCRWHLNLAFNTCICHKNMYSILYFIVVSVVSLVGNAH